MKVVPAYTTVARNRTGDDTNRAPSDAQVPSAVARVTVRGGAGEALGEKLGEGVGVGDAPIDGVGDEEADTEACAELDTEGLVVAVGLSLVLPDALGVGGTDSLGDWDPVVEPDVDPDSLGDGDTDSEGLSLAGGVPDTLPVIDTDTVAVVLRERDEVADGESDMDPDEESEEDGLKVPLTLLEALGVLE